MVSIKTLRLFMAGFFILGCCVSVAFGKSTVSVSMDSGSKVWLEGNSTLHPYESKTTNIRWDAQLELKTPPASSSNWMQAVLNSKDVRLTSLSIEMPVEKFESGIFGFDGNFNETLKFREFSNISFTLSNYTLSPDKQKADRFLIKATGNLKMAGKVNFVTLDMVATTSGTSAVIVGQKELLMTDYGMTPPNLFGGMIVTENKVLVKWELSLTLPPSSISTNSK